MNVLETARQHACNNNQDISAFTHRLVGTALERDKTIGALLEESERVERIKRDTDRIHSIDPLKQGNLHGILIGVKDIIAVEGLTRKLGSHLPPELFADDDADVIQQIKNERNAALILGKLTMDEFAYDHPPETVNPIDATRTPGGSSAGSAAAVAANICPVALATQTTSSIIAPASFCGIVGFKPTFGRVSTSGVFPVSPSMDAVGFMTADIESALQFAPCILDSWQERQIVEPKIAIPTQSFFQTVPQLAWERPFEDSARHIEEYGYTVTREDPFKNAKEILEINKAISELVYFELAESHQKIFEGHKSQYRPLTQSAIEYGSRLESQEARRARVLIQDMKSRIEQWMTANDIDVILCPSQLGPAPLLKSGRTSWSQSTMLWSAMGFPCVSLPAGNINGMPIGIQMIAKAGGDEKLLQAAMHISRTDINNLNWSYPDYDQTVGDTITYIFQESDS